MKNNTSPMFSFIIATFNDSTSLGECLDSIITQTNCIESEILIIDNCSTDDTESISKKYVSLYPFISYHFLDTKGVSNARNFGISHSAGQYLFFIDSDDQITPDTLSVIKNNLEDDIDVFIFGMKILNKQEHTEHNRLLACDFTQYSNEILLNLMIVGLFGSMANKLYRKKFLINHKLLLNTKMNISEDADFNNRVFQLTTKFFYINAPLYKYIQDSSTSSLSPYCEDLINILTIYNQSRDLLIFNKQLNNLPRFQNFMEIESCFQAELITINLFRKNNQLSFNQKRHIIRDSVINQNLVSNFENYRPQILTRKIYISLCKSNSSFLITLSYYILSYFRNNFSKVFHVLIKNKIK